jgi:hypothetical protein
MFSRPKTRVDLSMFLIKYSKFEERKRDFDMQKCDTDTQVRFEVEHKLARFVHAAYNCI